MASIGYCLFGAAAATAVIGLLRSVGGKVLALGLLCLVVVASAVFVPMAVVMVPLLVTWCCLNAGTIAVIVVLDECGVSQACINIVLKAFYVLCGITAYKLLSVE